MNKIFLLLLILPSFLFAQRNENKGTIVRDTAIFKNGIGTGARSAYFDAFGMLQPTAHDTAVSGGGGTFSGGIANHQVAFGNGTNIINGSDSFYYNRNKPILGIGTSTPGVVNGTDFSQYCNLHLKSSSFANTIVEGSGSAGFLFNDLSQTTDNHMYQVTNNGNKLLFNAATDAGTTTTHLSIGRTGAILAPNISAGANKYIVHYNKSTGEFTYADSTASGGSLPLTTTGDIIYSSSGSTAARRGIGSTGQVLTVSGGVPVWASSTIGNVYHDELGSVGSTASSTYAVPSTLSVPNTFLVSPWINVGSVSGGTVTVTVTATNGSGYTNTFYKQGSTTAALSTTGVMCFPPMTVRCDDATNIVVTYTVTGTISYTYSVDINKVH